MGLENETNDPGLDLAEAGAEISADLFGDTEADNANDDVNLDSPTPPTTGGDETAVEGSTSQPPATDTPATPKVAPPKTWRPEALTKWESLPPEVQAEVLKREEDMFKGLEGYKADANVGKAMKGVLDPYMPILNQYGIDPIVQVKNLMQAHYSLVTGTPEQKQALFQKLAQDYGVSLGGETPYVDPTVASLQKQVSELTSRLSGREQKEADTSRQQLQREIDTFASDPAHPLFDDVASDIAALLRSGVAKDLSEAYEKAVWANPVTRGKEQARLTAESVAKSRAEAEEKAKAVRKATGANVKSSAKAASGTAPLGSIDDTLQAALATLRAKAYSNLLRSFSNGIP